MLIRLNCDKKDSKALVRSVGGEKTGGFYGETHHGSRGTSRGSRSASYCSGRTRRGRGGQLGHGRGDDSGASGSVRGHRNYLLHAEGFRHQSQVVPIGIIALLLLFVLASAMPVASAASTSAELIELGLKWGFDAPLLTGFNSTSNNYTYDFSASLDGVGAITGFLAATFYIGETVGSLPVVEAESTPSFNLDAVELQGQLPFQVTFSGELEVDTVYFAVGCAVNAAGSFTFVPCEDSATDPGTEVAFFSFQVMDDGELFLFTPGTHPLAVYLLALQVDISLALFFIGMIPLVIMGLFMFMASKKGVDENDLFVPFIVIVSANMFLRFWPLLLWPFLIFFVGWMLLSRTLGFRRAAD